LKKCGVQLHDELFSLICVLYQCSQTRVCNTPTRALPASACLFSTWLVFRFQNSDKTRQRRHHSPDAGQSGCTSNKLN